MDKGDVCVALVAYVSACKDCRAADRQCVGCTRQAGRSGQQLLPYGAHGHHESGSDSGQRATTTGLQAGSVWLLLDSMGGQVSSCCRMVHTSIMGEGVAAPCEVSVQLQSWEQVVLVWQPGRTLHAQPACCLMHRNIMSEGVTAPM
jgi:hypothetical protein